MNPSAMLLLLTVEDNENISKIFNDDHVFHQFIMTIFMHRFGMKLDNIGITINIDAERRRRWEKMMARHQPTAAPKKKKKEKKRKK